MVGVSLFKLRTGLLEDEDWQSLYKAGDRLSQSSMYFDSAAALSPLEISSRIKQYMKNEHVIGLVVIDHLQLMKVKEHKVDSPELEAAEISHALKELASELNIVIIALSELDPEVDKRENNQPKLSDLLYFGAYEQAADAVLLMYQGARDCDGDESLKDSVDIHVAKNRNGPCGQIKLLLNRNCLRFKSFDEEDPLSDR